MTQPTPPMRWEDILNQVVGAKPFDRAAFADRPWFRMTNWQGWRDAYDDKPWEDAVPEGTGDGKFTVYRKAWRPNPDYGHKNGASQAITDFQILEFSVDYFVKGEGDRSPHDNYGRDWVTNFNDSIAQMNGVLDEQTFYSAANAFDNSVAWFQAASERLKPWIDNVNTEASGFQGSAAEAFRHQVLNLQYGFDKHREQLTTPSSWAALTRTAGDQAAAFKQTIQRSWQSYLGLPTPRDVIVSVLRQIEQQVDSWDKQVGRWEYGGNPKIPADWSWEVLLKVGDNVTMYNLVDTNDVAALDFMMRWAWANQVVEFLDRPANGAYTPLNTAIEATYTASASPITLFEYPTANPNIPNNPNNPNDPNKPPPNGGDGNNKDLPPPPEGGDGNNKDLPPPPGGEGGSDGNDPPPNGEGGGGNRNNLSLGGGGGGGSSGNLPPPPPPSGEGGSNGNIPPPTTLTTGGGGNGNIPPLSDLTNTGGSAGGSGGPGGLPSDIANLSGGGSGGGSGPLSNLLSGPPDAGGTGGPIPPVGSGALGFPLPPSGGGSTGGTNRPNAIDRLTGGVTGPGPFDDFTDSTAGGDNQDGALGGPVSGLGDLPDDVRTIASLPEGGGGAQGILGTGIPSLDNPPGGLPLPLQGGGSSGGVQLPDGGGPVGGTSNPPGSSFLDGSGSGGAGIGGLSSGGDGIGGLSPGGGGIGGLDEPGDGWEFPPPTGGSAGGLAGGPSTTSSGGDFSLLGENGPGGTSGGSGGSGDPTGSGPNGGFDANGLPIGELGAVDAPAPGPGGPQSTNANGNMGGMPFMPPMGGPGHGPGGGGSENKDRERSTWLTEDEGVWGTDPDCAPAVIGRDDSADFDLIERGDWERVPTEPSQPAKEAKPAGHANPTTPSRAR